MDNAIAAGDVRLRHFGIVHHHRAAVYFDGEILSLDGLGSLKLDHIGSHHLAGDHVVGENALQLGLVFRFQQIIERTGRQLGKCRIRGREDGKRAGTLGRVSTRLAALTAATSVLKDPAPTAVSTMSFLSAHSVA